ncbi:MAG TPA: phosphate ABC transporter permease PstA [Verrucomicrobiae bacterium]|nr:phosphate ABC transporter permease PstA [Verrucomicrobiae bacterium]
MKLRHSVKELWFGAMLACAVMLSLALLTWTGFSVSTILMLVVSAALFLAWLRLEREQPQPGSLRRHSVDSRAVVFTAATGLATFAVVAAVVIILGNIAWHGAGQISWRFIFGGTGEAMFDAHRAGIFPMIFGTVALVFLMTIGVLPVGVITAIYLNEYARPNSLPVRLIHGAINNLAGVPSIVFGLFGLGFFVQFVGGGIDNLFYGGQLHYRKPALIWAAATMAVMTLPVVIVATEESLRAVPNGLREGSFALGATKLETICRIVLPEAMPGVMTGAILAIGRGAGEVAPIMFTGAAYYLAHLPTHWTDQFMHLGYHVFVLSTQSPDIERTEPILYGSVLVLLALTFLLNLAGVLVRAKIRARMRSAHG